MDEDKASRFISSLVKSIQALCNGFVDFSNSIEVVGHIHLNIDRSVKLDYVLTEEVSKSVNEGSTVFASHSYHSHPPSSVSTKSASGSSNHNQKSRRDNDGDPLGLSALAREVPNSSKSDFHSGSRVGENSNSSSSVGFSRDSDSESIKPESSRLSSHFDDLSNRRRKMGPLSSQRTHSPAAKRSRVNDFGPNAKTVIKEQGFEVIEIKEEPDEEPNFFDSSGQMTAGQDIQTPDFSNVVMESLDRVTELEHGGGDGSGDMGSSQPVFPVMFHPSDGSMPSSSAGPMPGPSSDSQSVASTSGDIKETGEKEKKAVVSASTQSGPLSVSGQSAVKLETSHDSEVSKTSLDSPSTTQPAMLSPPAGAALSVPSMLYTRHIAQIPSVSPIYQPDELPTDMKAEDIARLTERHTLARVPPTEKKKYPSKRCKVCLRRSGYSPNPMRKHPKESVFYCPHCPSKPGLCAFPCYSLYHTKLNFWELDEGEEGGSGLGTSRLTEDSPGYGMGDGTRALDYVGNYGSHDGGSSQTSAVYGQAMKSVSGGYSLVSDPGYSGASQSSSNRFETGNTDDDDCLEVKFCPRPIYGESLYGPGGQ